MKVDFIEIGTSNFDTELQKANATTRGLSVEPVEAYLNDLPDKPNVTKVNAAISDTSGTIPFYWLKEADIRAHNLPDWLRGCGKLGSKHPEVMAELQRANLEHLLQTTTVPVLSVSELLNKYDVESIDYLKIDTEGHDMIILSAFIKHCTSNPHLWPKRIFVETKHCEENHVNQVRQALADSYSLRSSHQDDLFIRLPSPAPMVVRVSVLVSIVCICVVIAIVLHQRRRTS